MIAAIYARKSTDQRGLSDDEKSVARQIDAARAFAASKGWMIAEEHIYSDEAISGADTKRLVRRRQLLDVMEHGAPFDVVIMRDESRFSRRDGNEAFGELKAIARRGIQVWFYLDGQRFSYGTFETNTVGYLKSEFAAQYRREIAKWTYEAMARKARAGHVTGGRTFGYDNIRQPDGPVMRQIKPDEAAVIRTIFERCADGWGKTRIAKYLNDEHAPAPRAQQGRPLAWSPSSVHEVLYRDLYRGVIVWNRTKKRNLEGEVEPRRREQKDWMQFDAPNLRIVPEDLWRAAHDRLRAARDSYLRTTDGRLWGRPRDVESRYLLTGFMRCAECGATMVVASSSHGRKRRFVYRCQSVHKRGREVCRNERTLPMEATDRAVLDGLIADVLTEDVIADVITTVVDDLSPARLAAGAERLRTELATVTQEIGRLVAAIATTGPIPALVDSITERERRKRDLEDALRAAEAAVPMVDLATIRERVRARLQDWRAVLLGNVPQARQVLRKMLEQPMTATVDGPQVRLDGKASYGKLLQGIVEAAGSGSTKLASPTGIDHRRRIAPYFRENRISQAPHEHRPGAWGQRPVGRTDWGNCDGADLRR